MTTRERVKKYVFQFEEPTRKQLFVALSTVMTLLMTAYSFYNTHLHNASVAKQDTVIAAVKSDTSKSRRAFLARIDSVLYYDRIILARLDNITLGDQTIVQNFTAHHREDSTILSAHQSAIHSLNQAFTSLSAEVGMLQRHNRAP